MPRKISWLILFSIFIFALVLLVLNRRLYFSADPAMYSPADQAKPDEPSRGEKEFLDFSHQKKKLPRTREEVSLIAVGDISFSRGVERMVKKQNDPDYPFLKIRDYLKSADLVFGNLETPITAGPEMPYLSMIFRSNPGTEQALKRTGFSVLSLANNHTPNFGEPGLKDTFNYLAAAGLKYVGAGNNEQEAYEPVYLETKGIKFAFLAFNDTDVVPASYGAGDHRAGTAFMRIEKMAEAVKKAKQKADFVLISMHAGIEYIGKPNDSQKNFAHAAIDAGADLLIGHHPHVAQIVENYQGKYIFYSLGNFVFDQPWSPETKEGLAIKIYFQKDRISRIGFLPVVMENLAQPRMASASEAEKILSRLNFPLASQSVYSWIGGNNFAPGSKAIIYAQAPNKQENIFKQEQFDLDNDAVFEDYILDNGRLAISENSENVWQSSDDWWIDDFVLADANNDGIVDINLSLWKSGNFGSSKPLWVEENDFSVKNHFFVLNINGGSIKHVWDSSNLVEPNCEFKIADVDNDGKNDLIVIEGSYAQKTECRGSYIAVWKWNGWGFSHVWRSDQGEFSNLEIEKIDGKDYISADRL